MYFQRHNPLLSVINCYWMKLCNMVKILTCLVCCVNSICHVLHNKRSNSTPQHEVTFSIGHRLHSVIMLCNLFVSSISFLPNWYIYRGSWCIFKGTIHFLKWVCKVFSFSWCNIIFFYNLDFFFKVKQYTNKLHNMITLCKRIV
jgi:hypothetical protein